MIRAKSVQPPESFKCHLCGRYRPLESMSKINDRNCKLCMGELE